MFQSERRELYSLIARFLFRLAILAFFLAGMAYLMGLRIP